MNAWLPAVGDVLISVRRFQTHERTPFIEEGEIFVVVNVNTLSGDIDIISDQRQITWSGFWERITLWFERAADV